MNILLLIFSAVFIFFIFHLLSNKKELAFTNIRLSIIKTSLVLSFLVVVFTELLSAFNILNSRNITILWFSVSIISLSVFLYLFNKYKNRIQKINIIKLLKDKNFIISSILSFVIISGLFMVALTINNNWDSYTYHLPKVEHWIQNGNVEFYPTNNIRQLYLVPFVEYFILNLKLLSGSNIFNNFVQFLSLINCCILVSLIGKCFGLPRKWQLFSFILGLTIPMAILQSTTTQTDLVVSFFIISFIYFGLSSLKSNKWINIFFMCLSFSLGVLTKSTFYIFAFPFCVLFLIKYFDILKLKIIYASILLITVFLSINGPFLLRNFNQFGSFLGPQKNSIFYLANTNEQFGLREMSSNVVKNIGLHLSLPSDSWNHLIDRVLGKIHTIINYPINSPQTSWFGLEYKTIFNVCHDTIGNFLHVIFLLLSILIFILNIKIIPRYISFFMLCSLISYLLFSFLLKWQPWQTRLDLPFFFIVSPLIAYSLSLLKGRFNNIYYYLGMLSFVIISFCLIFIFDPKKPILGKESIFRKNNSSYIFGYNSSKKVSSLLTENNIKDVGLVIGSDSWEWQYWLLNKDINFECVYFNNELIKTKNFNPQFKYKALIIENKYLEDSEVDKIFNNKNILNSYKIDERESLIIYKDFQNIFFLANS